MTIAAGVELPEAGIAEICRRHQVKELSLFGSAARGEMRPDSDFDFLVVFLPEARPGLLGLEAMMRELAALLGRRVDLAVKPALKPLIRSGVLAEARLIYARDQQRLTDILEALDWIAKAIAGRTEADSLSDETLCYAVAQN